jgi:hypothetical protein
MGRGLAQVRAPEPARAQGPEQAPVSEQAQAQAPARVQVPEQAKVLGSAPAQARVPEPEPEPELEPALEPRLSCPWSGNRQCNMSRRGRSCPRWRRPGYSRYN